MIRLLFILLFIFFYLTNLSKAKYSEWSCNQFNSKNYLCKNIVTSNDTKMDVEYIGEAKNGKPNGKGDYTVVKINGVPVDQSSYNSIKASGIMETYPDNSIMIINGIINWCVLMLYKIVFFYLILIFI